MATPRKRKNARKAPVRDGGPPKRTVPPGRRRNPRKKARPLKASGRVAVSIALDLTHDTLVRECVLRLSAGRSNATFFGDAGDLRTDSALNTYVVDFGVLRTVSGVAAPVDRKITAVQPWNGLAFGDAVKGLERGGKAILRFSEIQTERLRFELDGDVGLDDVAGQGGVFLPGPPADLVLSIGDEPPLARFPGRVEPGTATEIGSDDWNADGERLVDITEALAGRLGNPLDPSPASIVITLTAGAPGALDLSIERLVTSRLTRVTLDGQSEALFDLDAEADLVVSTDFVQPAQVEGLRFALRGDHDDERVVDPVGGGVATDAELVADAHRSFAFRLPSPAGLGTITGVRLPIRAETSDAEARVTLWQSSAQGEPMETVGDGVSEPVSVARTPAGAEDDETWTTFTLVTPFPVPAGDAPTPVLWAALDVVRGTVIVSLAAGGAPGGAVGGETAAAVRRGTATGDWRRLPAVFELGQALAHLAPRVRVVGSEAQQEPRLPIRVALTTATSDAPAGAFGNGGLDVDPAGETFTGEFALAVPIVVGAAKPPSVRVVAYAAGSIQLSAVDLVWSELPPKISQGGPQVISAQKTQRLQDTDGPSTRITS